MTMAISRDHRAARNQASITFADSGAGPSTLKLMDGPGGMVLAVRTLAKPCGVITLDGRIMFQTAVADDLVAVTGRPTWCEWCSGHGVAIGGDVVTDEDGPGPFKLEGTSIDENGNRTGMIFAGGVVRLKAPMLAG